MENDLRRVGQQIVGLVAPAIPFVAHSVAAAAAFTTALGATQVIGYACRISCATPVLGSAVGLMGVGVASACAGQASLQCQRYYRGFSPLSLPSFRRQDLLIDAVIGISLWKAMGGRFKSVMPSDYFAPGAMAVESLPSPGSQYANDVIRGELARLFRRDGCHHCGTRSGSVVGDHIPPNRMVWGSSKEVLPASVQKQLAKNFGLAQTGRVPKSANRRIKKDSKAFLGQLSRRAQSSLGIEASMPKQRYYPQCKTCSGKQSSAVKMGKRTLILHFGGPKAHYYAGVMVGLRHFMATPQPPFGPEGLNSYRRNRQTNSGSNVDSFGLGGFFCIPAAFLDSGLKLAKDVIMQNAKQELDKTQSELTGLSIKQSL